MTQSNQSPQITYSLEDFLLRFEQKLDKRFENLEKNLEQRFETIDKRFENLEKNLEQRFETIDKRFENLENKNDKRFEKLENKIDALQTDVTDLKVGQVKLEGELKGEINALEEKVDGIGKRLDTQEFINRSVVVGFVLTVLAGLFKLFFPNLT